MSLAEAVGLDDRKRNWYVNVDMMVSEECLGKSCTFERPFPPWRSAPLLSNPPRLSMVERCGRSGTSAPLMNKEQGYPVLSYYVYAKHRQ